MRPGPTTPQRISCTRGTLAGAGRLRSVAVLIDTPVWPWRGRRWSHLVSDVSYEELHVFVETELGIPRRAFQGDHYDVPEDLYDAAVAAGAQPVGARELLGRLMAAGLRLKKARRGA
jgi:hypothetical protein